MAKRPVVGITSYDAEASWGVWKTRAALLPAAYVDSVLGAGGAPVVLPVGPDTDSLLDRLDGVVLVGGPDLDPARYGAMPDERSQPPSPRRDDFELQLAAGCLSRGLPLLAICRGLQVLNVLRGGTLHQHLPDVVGHEGHLPGNGVYGRTTVKVECGTHLFSILGEETVLVDCYHHQAIDQLGDCLSAEAYATDGTIEGVSDPTAEFVIGVQWHPEQGGPSALFSAFVSACGSRETHGAG